MRLKLLTRQVFVSETSKQTLSRIVGWKRVYKRHVYTHKRLIPLMTGYDQSPLYEEPL